jgi:protein-L-isoaspartate(D-aspartate) O-methyltransferase
MSYSAAAQKNMVDCQIRPQGVTDRRLVRALYKIDRAVFVSPALRPLAYMDALLQVEAASGGRSARFLPPPSVFARLAQLAGVLPNDKVLDIGSATGYSTAIFAQLAKTVVAVECDAGLAGLAKDALAALQISNAEVHVGPLEAGAPDKGPYQVIFVNGRLPRHPETLLAQLAPDGRLVAIIGNDVFAKAHIFNRVDTHLENITAFDVMAPLLPGFEEKRVFTF